MKCPYCGAEESKVIDSRPTEDNERIRRRRECLNCHMRFTTYEVVETVPLVVIKRITPANPLTGRSCSTPCCAPVPSVLSATKRWNVLSAALSRLCSAPTTARSPVCASAS